MNSKRKGKKRLLITVIFAIVVVLAAAIAIPQYVQAQNDAKKSETSSETRTVTVSTQNISKAISGSGQIVTGDEEILTPDEAKTVDEVLVSEGQAVKKGQALLTYTNGTKLKSPCNGVVGAVSVAEGDSGNSKTAGTASSGTIIVKSTEQLVTQLSVDETDLQNLKVGQAAEITVNALPDTKYSGKVSAISETGTYSNGSSTFTVTIALADTTNVKIGMSADVEIVIASVTDAVAVPIEAVSGSGDNATVMVVRDGAASPVSVKLGLANDAYVQITDGLSVGDMIQYTVQASSSSGNYNRMGNFGGMGGIQAPSGNMSGRNSSGGNQAAGGRISSQP